MVHRMIPALWLRIIVLIAFMAYIVQQSLPWLTLIAAAFALPTGLQLWVAYRSKKDDRNFS
ncbi:hypothetical protein CHUV2995_01524 [Corynebacterium diphtheriae subsp. lausannense]|nr:hypothetical protein [Corynebacterium belfantii]OLN15431.1 hypothetical protein BUE64_07315 [Corynebacterium diphtheriae subsp. lausannense]STC66761.1 hypothetical membrane protein [Corynebacterium diphtheriae]OWM37966.1 hypothetical protein AZF07_05705 [Corynebacterium diphtheriae subsp. lausannense]SNW30774.1 hypothetical protein FRC0043_00467 [Corynebacterium belfantii]